MQVIISANAISPVKDWILAVEEFDESTDTLAVPGGDQHEEFMTRAKSDPVLMAVMARAVNAGKFIPVAFLYAPAIIRSGYRSTPLKFRQR